ncbi:hypothetical protein TELCIR_24048, partial [Teladorsagia circumcincta]
ILGVLLCILWQIFVSDDPANARGITNEEIQVITSAAGRRPRVQRANWAQLLSSPVVWSIAGSAFAHNFITVGTVTYLPLYYKTVLNMSLTSQFYRLGIRHRKSVVGKGAPLVCYGSCDQISPRSPYSNAGLKKSAT